MTTTPSLSLRLAARRMALGTTLLSPVVMTVPAEAQSIPVAPIRELTDDNGVDLFRGVLVVDETVASLGADQGLAYRRINRGQADFTDNMTAVLQSDGSSTVLASVDGRTDRFTVSSGVYTPTEANGSTLSYNSTTKIYTYQSRDGTVVTFDQRLRRETTAEANVLGFATSIVRPDGGRIDLAYDTFDICLLGPEVEPCLPVNRLKGRRLHSVSNANGYIYRLFYESDQVETQADEAAWMTVTDRRLVNRGIDYCDPAGGCTLTRTWPGPDNPNHVVNSYVFTSGRITGIRRPGSTSNDLTIGYDQNGRVSSIADHSGTTTYAYADASGVRTVTVTNALNEVSVYTFNIASERLTGLTNPLGQTTSYTYDTSGRLTQVTRPEGNYTQLAYDGRGNVTSTTHVAKSGSGLSNIVTSASYASNCSNPVTCNSPTSTTDARGKVTDYTYDSTHGGVLTVTGPAPTSGASRPQLRYSYATKQAQVKNLSGSIVGSGQNVTVPVSVAQCISATTCATSAEVKSTVTYGTTGVPNNLLPTEIARGSGDGALTAITKLAYDADGIGNLVSVDGPLSGTEDTTTALYDDKRRVIGTIAPDPDGSGSRPRLAQRNTFAVNGDHTRVEIGTVTGTTQTALDGMTVAQTIDHSFDADGRRTRETLSSGSTMFAVTQFAFDAEGRATCTAQRMNPAAFSSAPSSACTHGTSGSFGPDRITRLIRDANGRVTQVREAFGVTGQEANERTLSYTTNGQLARLTDANLNRTTYEYDGHDRLVKTRYPVTTIGQDTSSSTDYEQLTLDAAGNVTQRRLRDAQVIGYTFDDLGRMTAKDLPGSEPDATYAFDLLGRMTQAVQNSITNSFSWDALGRLTSETAPQGTVSSQYDLAGRRTRVTLPGSTSLYADYDYDVTGNVTAIRENGATSGVGVLATYAHDSLGRRSSVTFGNGVSQAFTYDGASRLASLGNDLSGTSNDLAHAFTYSPASQIASLQRTGDTYAFTARSNASDSSSVSGLNQIANVGSKTITHDARGNITAVGSDGYAYSSENLLASGPNSSTLAWDPMMRLYQVASGSSTTRFGYDVVNRIAEYDGSNALTRRYIHGTGTDEPIVWYEGADLTDRRFLSADERGSIISVSDGSGSLLGINRYDEYGIPSSTNLGKFGYTGQTWLPEVGLWHYKARAYRPDIGRFMQTDPIRYGDGTNWYAYVGNDAVNFVDPLGQFSQHSCITIGVQVGDGPLDSRRVCRVELTYAPPHIDRGGGGLEGGGGALIGKIGRMPNAPETKPLSQCVQEFMSSVYPSFDWSQISISSAKPLPGAVATNWGTTINVGSKFENFETDRRLLFHELAHSPQWASGQLTRLGYVGSSLMAFLNSLNSARMGRGFHSQRQMHGSIRAEQAANIMRDSLLKAYRDAGRPCDEK